MIDQLREVADKLDHTIAIIEKHAPMLDKAIMKGG